MKATAPIAATLAAFFLIAILGGCTEHERRGISPIPQNRPAEWEIRPYGPSFGN